MRTTLRRAMAAATRAARSRGVRASFLALALATAVWAIAAQWDGVIAGLREVTPAVLALAFTLGVAYVWVTMAAWRVVLLALGAPVPNTVTRTIFFVSQVAKYLPGGVWNIVAAAEMGADHEISRRRSVSAMAISLLLTVITGLMLACAVVLWGPSELRERYGWIVVLLPLLLLTLSPWALNRVLAVVGQGSEGPAMRVRLGTVITAGLLTILSWTLAGSQLYLLATSMVCRRTPRTTSSASAVTPWRGSSGSCSSSRPPVSVCARLPSVSSSRVHCPRGQSSPSFS